MSTEFVCISSKFTRLLYNNIYIYIYVIIFSSFKCCALTASKNPRLASSVGVVWSDGYEKEQQLSFLLVCLCACGGDFNDPFSSPVRCVTQRQLAGDDAFTRTEAGHPHEE